MVAGEEFCGHDDVSLDIYIYIYVNYKTLRNYSPGLFCTDSFYSEEEPPWDRMKQLLE